MRLPQLTLNQKLAAVALVLGALGALLAEDLGRPAESVDYLRRAWEAEVRVAGERNPNAMTATNNYARALGLAGRWAEALSSRVDHPVEEVVFVEDMARYGLHLHMGVAVEKVSLEARPREPYGAEFDSSFAGELLEREDALWVTKQALFPQLVERAAPLGFRLVPLGEPYEGRVVFRVER